MTCQEAERLVTPYIRDELAGDELEAFLNHIDECPNCREELEIYFMVDVGLSWITIRELTTLPGIWSTRLRNPI